MQNIIKIIIFLIFFFIISVFYISLTRETNYDTSNLINKKIIEFKVINADETGFYTKDDLKKNDFILINFWASWCAPCLRSMPAYNELYNRYHDQGLEFVAINVDNPIEDGLDFLLDTPLDFLIPSDPDGEVTERFGVVGMPTSYLIDPTGKVRLVHMGFRDGDMEEIEAAIQAVMAE